MTDAQTWVFIPQLRVLLVAAEDAKGEPLSPDEVLKIRDDAAGMLMDAAAAEQFAATRGEDLDPENLWYDWQHLRRALGRTPDLDPGAKLVTNASGAFAAEAERARASLDEFRRLIAADIGSALVKVRVEDADAVVNMWLFVIAVSPDGFTGEFFEAPPSLPSWHAGDRLDVPNGDVLDWMVNDDGTMHGAFSLRAERDALTDDAARAEFDDYIGARDWA